MDAWTIAKEVDPIGQNSKGDPVRAIKTDTGGWLKLSGAVPLLEQIFPGAKVRHGPVKVYGKSSFATLYFVEKPAPPPPPPPAAKPATEPPAPKPSSNWPNNGAAVPASTMRTMAQCKLALFEFHKWAVMCEPEAIDQAPDANPVYLDRAQARAAIVNTLMIAFTNGKIEAPKEAEPDIPGLDAPMPDDEDFKWSRAVETA
jgi:hypothetical protein